MSEREIVTLATVTDAYHFRVGDPIECRMTSSGDVRLAMWRERATGRMVRTWDRWTRWWRPRASIVSMVDHELGAITLVAERWSWRRWRWERG